MQHGVGFPFLKLVHMAMEETLHVEPIDVANGRLAN
jgi:hypothetical protein